MGLPFGVTLKELFAHALVLALGSALAWPVGYFFGLNRGINKGEAVAAQAANRVALDAATETRKLITAEFIKQEVERAYKTELDAREQVGIEKGRKSAGYSCALEDFYKIIRGYIAQGGAARSSQDVVIIAQNIVRIKGIGAESLGEIGGKVLNGQIDELADALLRGERDRVGQLLKGISASLEARDRSFQHAKEKLASAK